MMNENMFYFISLAHKIIIIIIIIVIIINDLKKPPTQNSNILQKYTPTYSILNLTEHLYDEKTRIRLQ